MTTTDQPPTQNTPDPAAIWASAAPPRQLAGAGADDVPAVAAEPEWRWGWSMWIGIHYGPVPVGLLIAIPLLLILRS